VYCCLIAVNSQGGEKRHFFAHHVRQHVGIWYLFKAEDKIVIVSYSSWREK
jgi:hypothetical protein